MDDLKALTALIEHLKRLPGVGQKSAERIAQSLLSFEQEVLQDFGQSISELRNKIHFCPTCGYYTENDLCTFCRDNERNSQTLIVVSYPKDIQGFLKLDQFNGRFHILGGLISPSQNKGADALSIDKLEARIKSEGVNELIIATNPTVEGELTALFLSKKMANAGVKITRLAYGLPMGGQVDYADALTLLKAIEGRKDLK